MVRQLERSPVSACNVRVHIPRHRRVAVCHGDCRDSRPGGASFLRFRQLRHLRKRSCQYTSHHRDLTSHAPRQRMRIQRSA